MYMYGPKVDKMRRAGKLAHAALDVAGGLIVPGQTTEEMDKAGSTQVFFFFESGGFKTVDSET